MSYVNWNQSLDQLDLGFLKPLLGAVSATYNQQWESTAKDIRGKDPYGSSISEDRMARAKAGLDAEAAKNQSDMIMQYYRANQEKKLTDQMEKQKEKYEQMLSSAQQQYNSLFQKFSGGSFSPPPGVALGTVVNPGSIAAGPSDMGAFPTWPRGASAPGNIPTWSPPVSGRAPGSTTGYYSYIHKKPGY